MNLVCVSPFVHFELGTDERVQSEVRLVLLCVHRNGARFFAGFGITLFLTTPPSQSFHHHVWDLLPDNTIGNSVLFMTQL